MDTSALKKFAQSARRQLREQVAAKLEYVLNTDSAELRSKEKALKDLKEQIASSSKEAVVDRVAYVWFNRFCALRFMDINRYTRMGTVSPAEGFTQPEILQEAKQGHIDDELERFIDKEKVFGLLGNRIPSSDPQQEAYRLLLVAVCNFYNTAMPFMFEKISDYTELLMPDDLLSENSILHATREAIDEDSNEVETIGWLYQFYISEKKDEVFADLKKNKKITPENIPAATQLFTPHWIVRYLVENSLGRLWMLNHPDSKLTERMDYYIKPEQAETDFLRIASPEEIKVCDPACGSGHILTYAFDLLHAIYEEQGYDAREIPHLILKKNLHGIEIDERAGELAAFALIMKAREKSRRFLRKASQPNICVLENILFRDEELDEYMDAVGRDLFTQPLQDTLIQFRESDNFGSLIRPALRDVSSIRVLLEDKDMAGNIFLHKTHQRVLKALKQADYLSQKYHVAIANPPYMGGKGMNGELGKWLKENYPDSKSDLMTAFMERIPSICLKSGYWGMINLPSWMFLSSYEKLRKNLLRRNSFESLLHLGRGVFGSDFGSVAFVLKNSEHLLNKVAIFRRLFEKHVQVRTVDKIRCAFMEESYGKFITNQMDFSKISGSPIAYWVSEKVLNIFSNAPRLKQVLNPKQGTSTGDDEVYVRFWFEIANEKLGLGLGSLSEALNSNSTYFPLDKGGEFRRWYGNNEKVIKLGGGAYEELLQIGNHLPSRELYFKKGLTWSKITASKISVRFDDDGFVFSSVGLKGFPDNPDIYACIGYMNSKLVERFTDILSPTLSIISGDIERLPYIQFDSKRTDELSRNLIAMSKQGWDSYETSWNFSTPPLLSDRQKMLKETYQKLRIHWFNMVMETKRLEERNNRIFIEAYGLQDELTPDVPLKEITLTCNPHYRYGGNKTEAELETLLLADTMKEFISYAVGCMFGRYSLDKEGLILANQGETLADYLKQVPEPSFMPDDDNVIPVLDGEWFTDDITERFQRFLKTTFGEDHYQDNIEFIERAIGKDLRKYFLKDFYNDHVKRYKKRPIYWMFSSPSGSFNALIYLHRYQPSTVSVVLNGYLREFRTKLAARKEHLEQVSNSASASQRDKVKALKDIENLKKVIDELETWERDVLYPLATQQIEIDLDDGVKVNYPKFGSALKKIVGLS